jgi:uncharacterized OsmC-like protein
MSEIEYRTLMARSYSSGTPGRAICNSRNHHFIADEFDGDEVTAGEYFLTGLTACAVNMIERVAAESSIPLQKLDVGAEGVYKRNQGTESHTLFETVKIRFQFAGVNTDEAEILVATYHRRCPLYGTVSAATPDVSTTIVTDPN